MVGLRRVVQGFKKRRNDKKKQNSPSKTKTPSEAPTVVIEEESSSIDDASQKAFDRIRIQCTSTTIESTCASDDGKEEEVAVPEEREELIRQSCDLEHPIIASRESAEHTVESSLSQRFVCCGAFMDFFPTLEDDTHIPTEYHTGTMKRRAPKKNRARTDTAESIECFFQGERDNANLERSTGSAPPDSVQIERSGGSDPSMVESVSQSCVSKRSESSGVACCKCGSNDLPPLDPMYWPQAPLLFRPQPKSGTRILGIRRDHDKVGSNYIWKPNDTVPWWRVLQQQWDSSPTPCPEVWTQPYCEFCTILPVNNGNEAEGESLVVDFETHFFRGSLLVRLRHAHGTTPEPPDDNKGYFAGKPLRYQAVIRGQFKKQIPISELVTGTRLDRPCGKLPPKFVTWTALKVVHFFAPQLKTKLDGDKPYSLCPLGSAPRTVIVEDDQDLESLDKTDLLLGTERVEPTTPKYSLTGIVYPQRDPLDRARARKRHLDQMYMNNNKSLVTDPLKTYTFEFLQHLFDYQEFTIDLGSFHFKIQELLDGQPLQLMAEHEDGNSHAPNNNLWSFEIWNQCLVESAKQHILSKQ